MLKHLSNSILAIALFGACGLLSWHLLSKADFFFTQIYEYNELEDHIDHYAPQNRNRDDFEATTRQERVRIFGEIVTAINSDGSGLDDIEYRTRSGEKIDKFLTDPEIEHLSDVSDLVSYAYRVGLIVAGALAAFYLSCKAYKSIKGKYLWKPASVSSSFISMLILTSIIVAAVFAVGPQTVFYALHEVFFADKAQWYFYFQDSLMTTLMPESVFAIIAVILLLATLLLWTFFSILITRFLK